MITTGIYISSITYVILHVFFLFYDFITNNLQLHILHILDDLIKFNELAKI